MNNLNQNPNKENVVTNHVKTSQGTLLNVNRNPMQNHLGPNLNRPFGPTVNGHEGKNNVKFNKEIRQEKEKPQEVVSPTCA
jgi:hypothetical protein